jgi:Flp pilus assembly protein TadG
LRKRIRRLWRDEKGQSLVEMAVVLPVLILLFCGIVDFGWIMGNQIVAENGCREGARLGSVVATNSDYASRVSSRVMAVTPDYSHAGLNVKTTLSNPSDPDEGDVTVKITYTFPLLTPLVQTILGKSNYTVTSVCIMKVE